MAYTIVAHPLLSPAANEKGSDELTEQQAVAERVLGLSGTAYSGTAKADAERALALQVSLQVATDPVMYLAQSETRGSRSVTWRNEVPIHPLALEIAEALFAEDLGTESAWPSIVSLR